MSQQSHANFDPFNTGHKVKFLSIPVLAISFGKQESKPRRFLKDNNKFDK